MFTEFFQCVILQLQTYNVIMQKGIYMFLIWF